MYDAIIIGAGIGGLVCGCYLAKAGMKVLICEQHYKPGGYCTSFTRQGFTFDAAPHCFGSYRKDGMMRKILQDLEVDKKLNIIRPDPSDIIMTPDYEVIFWNDFERTTEGFQRMFPEDRTNIRNFFTLLMDTDPNSFSRMKNRTFKELLDQYLTNVKLKSILSFPFLGIGGLPSSMISAFIGAKLFSEFLFDGGYYPEGGMQALPDALAERLKEFGGELRLSCPIKKIRVRENRVTGVISEKDGFMPSRYVISNCDARQTFFKLIGGRKVEREFSQRLKKMVPSISNFIVYMGIDGHFETLPRPGTTLSFFRYYDIEKAYRSVLKGDFEGYGGYMLRASRDTPVIIAIIPVPFKNKTYWKDHKQRLSEYLIERIERDLIPNLTAHIVYKDASTPSTLNRYTLNYKGASFGWAGIPSQLAVPGLRKCSYTEGLYLTGHWTTLGVGISGVAYVGYDTAKILIRREVNRQNISFLIK
ncbi:MAG: NAD(P)/FAD-dependent oxidoreductase [Nitrospirae bacterium]|nr:NAD(P)/FAD-dependent oxidoreductase [Nitrospirota bacterium]